MVTIDGPAGSGKSTIARLVARRLGLPCLNSGAIYRAVTLAVLDHGVRFDDVDAVRATIGGLDLEMRDDPATGMRCLLDGRDVTERLTDPAVTAEVYRIANRPEYRALLVERQRAVGRDAGVVAEGRDMGTVIFPDADAKIFLDASPEERARRRHRELESRGDDSSFDDVLESVRERDARDRNRSSAPLVAAPDAVQVDSGGLTVEEALERVLEIVETARAGRTGGTGDA